jgi:hypothetical protein
MDNVSTVLTNAGLTWSDLLANGVDGMDEILS